MTGLLVVNKSGNSSWSDSLKRVVQMFYDVTANGNISLRTGDVVSGTVSWQPWRRLDNFGCNTPADLASLLGGLSSEPQTDMTSEMLDTNVPGSYLVDSSLSPFGCPGAIYVIRRNNMRCQVFVSSNVESIIAHRYKGNVSTAYSQWEQFYNTSLLTNSALLSPLASALGGGVRLGTITPSDYDTTVSDGLYTVIGTSSSQAVTDWGTLLVTTYGSYIWQRKFVANKKYIIERFKTGANWSDWYQNYSSSILSDTESLSPLAAALGVFKYEDYENASINKVLFGFYMAGQNATGRPDSAEGTLALASFVISENGARGFQIAKALLGTGIWVRHVLNDSWSSWHSIKID